MKISPSPKCTHPTGRHTLKLCKDTKPMRPNLECMVCDEKFFILSEQQFYDIQKMTPTVRFIPPIKTN